MIQETICEDIRFLGYRAYSTLIHKGVKCIQRDLAQNTTIEHIFTEILTGHRAKRDSLFLLNIYNGPGHPYNGLRALLMQASRLAGKHPLIVGGDFNAENQTWGYRRTTVKGRELLAHATEAGLILITDPAQPTRIGTSVYLRSGTPHPTLPS